MQTTQSCQKSTAASSFPMSSEGLDFRLEPAAPIARYPCPDRHSEGESNQPVRDEDEILTRRTFLAQSDQLFCCLDRTELPNQSLYPSPTELLDLRPLQCQDFSCSRKRGIRKIERQFARQQPHPKLSHCRLRLILELDPARRAGVQAFRRW